MHEDNNSQDSLLLQYKIDPLLSLKDFLVKLQFPADEKRKQAFVCYILPECAELANNCSCLQRTL